MPDQRLNGLLRKVLWYVTLTSERISYDPKVGQLTVLLVLAAFLKFFVFVDSADFNEPYDLRYRESKKKPSSVIRSSPSLSASAILAKTYYNTVSHRAESLDWFNVLVAQAFAQFRHDARSQDAILISLDAIFNGSKRPDFLVRTPELVGYCQ